MTDGADIELAIAARLYRKTAEAYREAARATTISSKCNQWTHEAENLEQRAAIMEKAREGRDAA